MISRKKSLPNVVQGNTGNTVIQAIEGNSTIADTYGLLNITELLLNN